MVAKYNVVDWAVERKLKEKLMKWEKNIKINNYYFESKIVIFVRFKWNWAADKTPMRINGNQVNILKTWRETWPMDWIAQWWGA